MLKRNVAADDDHSSLLPRARIGDIDRHRVHAGRQCDGPGIAGGQGAAAHGQRRAVLQYRHGAGAGLDTPGAGLHDVEHGGAELQRRGDGGYGGRPRRPLVLGANKNLDTLAIADGGLPGRGAGTLSRRRRRRSTRRSPRRAWPRDGLLRMGVARFTFDPTATAGMRTQAAHGRA